MRLLPLLLLCAPALPGQVSWTPMGPHHLNGRAGLIQSGKVQALAVFPGDSLVMYAGGGNGSGTEGPPAQGGVWKTTDGGATWTAVNNGITDPMVDALWVDANNPNLALAGTENDGIFRTTDGGATWSRIGNYGPASDFLPLNGTLLAAVSTGIVQSPDGGATWTPLLAGGAPVRTLAAGGGALIAGTASGVVLMQSATGSQFAPVLQVQGRSVWSVAIDPNAPSHAFAILGLGSPVPTLMATTNGGASWSAVNAFGADQPQTVAYAPSIQSVLLGTSGGLWISSDGGTSWHSSGPARFDARRIFWNDAAKTLYMGTDQGVSRSTDTASFTGVTGGLRNSILSGLAVKGSTIFVATHDFDPLLSLDTGATWTQPSLLSAASPVGEDGAAAISGGSCYAFTSVGFYSSTDACKTFHQASAPELNNAHPAYVMPGGANIIATSPGDSATVLVATQAGVLRSTNSGATLAAAAWPMTSVTAIAIHPSDPKTILVGTSSGLSRTQDGGATWSAVSLPASGFPATIAFLPADPRVVLVGLNAGPSRGGGVLRSTDGGATFHLANTGLPTAPRLPQCCSWDTLSIRFSADGLAALAMAYGIFVSADQGQSWQNITANSTATYFADVAWDSGFLYAATYGGGVMRTPLAASTLSVSPASLSFAGGGAPQTIAVSAASGAAPFTAAASTTSGGTWLAATPAAGSAPANVTVTVDASALAAGQYTGKVTISSGTAANAPLTVAVTLTVSAAAPAIVVTDVVNGASYLPAIAPNTWITVRGTLLSDTTRPWTGDDFQNGKLPTALDGVSVSIDGIPAYVAYVSPTQINALSPLDSARGSVPVTVRNGHGSSAPVSASLNAVAPAFFLVGAQLPVATHADGSLVGTPDLAPGASPAKPGETIVLYGAGFGPTSPPTPAGILAVGVASLAAPPTAQIGGAPATVAFAGIISPGLYQINLVVPDVPDGSALLTVTTADGTQTPDGFIAVKR